MANLHLKFHVWFHVPIYIISSKDHKNKKNFKPNEFLVDEQPCALRWHIIGLRKKVHSKLNISGSAWHKIKGFERGKDRVVLYLFDIFSD